jgi:hypothetical protein
VLDPLHDLKQGSFGGEPCAQVWADFYLWEVVLNENPQLRGIVELGTWRGGFTRYLHAQATVRWEEPIFKSYDIFEPAVAVPGFEKLDIYRYADRVKGFLGTLDAPVALFCDGGNKPRELATFPASLPERSVVIVHDWGTETLLDDVPDNLVECYGELCDSIHSMSRVFTVVL